MLFLITGIVAFLLTILFDFVMFKIEEKREIEYQWKLVNEQREKEGKSRWDKQN